MLLISSNTPISKLYYLCLNPCLDIPTKSKFYVMNLVTKHNKDLNSKSLIYRKIGPLYVHIMKGHYLFSVGLLHEILFQGTIVRPQSKETTII